MINMTHLLTNSKLLIDFGRQIIQMQMLVDTVFQVAAGNRVPMPIQPIRELDLDAIFLPLLLTLDF